MNVEGPRKRLLPENAYRALKPGESYKPIMPGASVREITKWSVTLGIIMVIVFTAACIYIALRAGSGIEAAIPIAVAAIFFGRMRKTRSTILENVIVQSIGQAAGVVAAGAAFVVPALYLNGVQPEWWQIFLGCFLGGTLGVVLIIPLRKYFVADRHGELPFPEGTATTEILVSGESSSGSGGKILVASFGFGVLYDFLVEGVHAFPGILSSKQLLGRAGAWLHDFRIELQMGTQAVLFGLGYIIGVKYAAIIMAGSVLACFVIVPLVYLIGQHVDVLMYAGQEYHLAAMSTKQIWLSFARPIGIGAIAVSGVIGLIRMGGIIKSSVSLGFKSMGKKGRDEVRSDRTQLDMRPTNVLLVQLLSTLALGALFFVVCVTTGDYSILQSMLFALVGMVICFLLCFLFTPVAAEAIAIVGVNPVSGMTLVTVMIACLTMAAIGLSGIPGLFVALVIGTAVCTALSTSGALISDFKIGYWIGATPRNQQLWKFVGVAVASLVVAAVIPLMDSSYHFLITPEGGGAPVPNSDVLPAPQANMLAPVAKALMTGGAQPYLLYGLGGFIALMLTMVGIPALAFSLGMFLPVSLNMAVLAGGIVAWAVARSGKTKEVREARKNQGTLIASGLMAGGAIIGIVTAALRLDWTGFAIQYISIGRIFSVQGAGGDAALTEEAAAWYTGLPGQVVGIAMVFLLVAVIFFLARWGANLDLADSGNKNGAKKK